MARTTVSSCLQHGGASIVCLKRGSHRGIVIRCEISQVPFKDRELDVR